LSFAAIANVAGSIGTKTVPVCVVPTQLTELAKKATLAAACMPGWLTSYPTWS
jgi:hypothetical protein